MSEVEPSESKVLAIVDDFYYIILLYCYKYGNIAKELIEKDHLEWKKRRK